MQSLNYKALGETLKIILFPSDSLIRRVNFTSQLQKVPYEVTPATACKVCPSLALVSSLRRSTEETNEVQWPYNSRVTVSRPWNTRSPQIPVIVKRPRYVAIKKRILSFKIYPPLPACRELPPPCCGLRVNIPGCGSKKPFCGFVTPFPYC